MRRPAAEGGRSRRSGTADSEKSLPHGDPCDGAASAVETMSRITTPHFRCMP